MHTRDIQALIGDTISGIFAPGYNQQSHYIRFGDTIGVNDYTDIIEHFHSVVFVACTGTYQIGSGTGVMGDTKDSIETYCHDEETFWMKDITRCGYHDPHGHDGNMHFLSSIKTYFHAGGDSFTIASDIDNNWTGQVQRPAVDAQVYTGWTYDFMWHTLGRNGPDSVGGSMNTMVNYIPDTNYAFYDTIHGEVYIGMAGTGRRSFAGALDILAHEWGHGITFRTSHLGPEGEPRALNESFSDMLGVYVASDNNDDDWWIGENTRNDNLPLRDMADPHNSNPPQPAIYYEEGYWDSSWTDPYINMGVPNKMFYLLSDGGYFNGVEVTEIGIENSIQVMYRVNTEHWDSLTGFWSAREDCIDAALELDETRQWAEQVVNAWNAVGVCDTCQYVPGDANCNGFATGSDVSYLVAFFKEYVQAPENCVCSIPYMESFYVTADYNGNCQITGADVTYAVSYFKGFLPYIKWCLDFSPDYP